jgi:hypothetical protein
VVNVTNVRPISVDIVTTNDPLGYYRIADVQAAGPATILAKQSRTSEARAGFARHLAPRLFDGRHGIYLGPFVARSFVCAYARTCDNSA